MERFVNLFIVCYVLTKSFVEDESFSVSQFLSSPTRCFKPAGCTEMAVCAISASSFALYLGWY